VISRLGLLVLDVSDCHFDNPPPFHERVFALRVADGRLAWVFDPPRADPGCDWDFGATANLGVYTKGNPTFLGVGGKDGTYYSLDPRTGRLRWSRNVVFGGFAGGFIPTTAYDGHRVYGATALGDFGRFEGVGELFCAPNPRDLPVQEPSMHAVDAATGNVAWQGVLNQSFAPTTVAGGMTFNGTALTREIVVRDADTGAILNVLPLLAPNDSGIAIVNNALYFGTGSSEQGSPTGVYCYAPA
jgi:polyvinyl alcohol dehydrogenase (cytochrome)